MRPVLFLLVIPAKPAAPWIALQVFALNSTELLKRMQNCWKAMQEEKRGQENKDHEQNLLLCGIFIAADAVQKITERSVSIVTH